MKIILMVKFQTSVLQECQQPMTLNRKNWSKDKLNFWKFIDKSKEQALNVDSFLKMVRKYTDITELTAEIIRSFVERIDVYKPEKVPGTRTKKKTICIHCNFIDAVDIPAEHEKTA